jgi:hypothetical protein
LAAAGNGLIRQVLKPGSIVNARPKKYYNIRFGIAPLIFFEFFKNFKPIKKYMGHVIK